MFKCLEKKSHPVSVEKLKGPKVGLVVGHTRLAKGAINAKGDHEYDFWLNVVSPVLKKTLELENFECEVITRDIGGIKGAYESAE